MRTIKLSHWGRCINRPVQSIDALHSRRILQYEPGTTPTGSCIGSRRVAFYLVFKWSSWFASVVKQATYGHCQATSGQILKVYFLYLRLFVCNKSAEIIAIIWLLIDAYARRILLQTNNVICCCMILLEIVVDLWIEYPFSPFLRQCIALFEQLKIVKFMNLFPNSTRE